MVSYGPICACIKVLPIIVQCKIYQSLESVAIDSKPKQCCRWAPVVQHPEADLFVDKRLMPTGIDRGGVLFDPVTIIRWVELYDLGKHFGL